MYLTCDNGILYELHTQKTFGNDIFPIFEVHREFIYIYMYYFSVNFAVL
jgi:hypothetical protein